MIHSEEYTRLLNLERCMTYEEYRYVKSQVDYYWACKLFDKHIGTANRIDMGKAPVIGKSKYPVYCSLYKLFNSKLYKALK